MNILDMAREGCAFELRAALHQAVTQHRDIQRRNLKVKAMADLSRQSTSHSQVLKQNTKGWRVCCGVVLGGWRRGP